MGKYLSSCKVDFLITVGNDSKYIEDGIKVNNKEVGTFHSYNNDDAYDKILQILKKNDKILVKGSRGMKTENIVRKLFDRFKNEIEGRNEKSQNFY